ncbi:SLOG family protein [Brevibacillus laterosporus]|uniref:SLOG family protein n=1 Tax=Brevibacillus laterosporus TaxID=1465 RepID=UPI003D1BCEF5
MFDFGKALRYINSEEYKLEKAAKAERERQKEELRKKTACFTGHRPPKLGGYDIKNPKMMLLKEKLIKTIEMVIEEEGVTRFISGGALGTDTLAFYCVHFLKDQYPHIKNILSVPFENQDKVWSEEQKKWYRKMFNLADEVIYVDKINDYIVDDATVGDYHPSKLQKRNEYMVDNSKVVIAVYDGSKGGTSNCLWYARKSIEKRVIYQLDPNYEFRISISYMGIC